jgi:predicted amidohydrolase
MAEDTLKIALIQMSVVDDRARNVAAACARIDEAARQGAGIVVLPEMFTCLYANPYFVANAEPQGGPTWQAMSASARENGVTLVAGTIPESDGGKIYNTSFVFNPQGEQVVRHRKVHLFDIAVVGGQHFRESATFSPGRDITVFDTPYGRMGVCVCFDIRFPELSRLMALKGARAIIVPGAFNMTTGPAHWELAFRQRAVDNQLFTVGVAPARDENGIYVSYGNSIVCSPWGEVLYRAGAEESTLLADVDLSLNEKIRAQLPLLSAMRHDLYTIGEK